jgi:excisionase family DNA binding protein
MRTLSTTEAARRLKLSRMSLYRHISSGKVAAPPSEVVGGVRVRLWSARDIERVRKQLPKIKSGRRKRKKK